MSWKTLCCNAALSAAAFFAGNAGAVNLSGNINSHDPAGLIKDGGTYYHFTTGSGVWYSYSTNLTHWTPASATVFRSGQWPAWINTAVPGFAGNFWAPDAIYMNGYYYLYYSASTFGSSRSAIGVTRTASLVSPSWQDQGVVVQSNGSSNVINAIDPALFTDTNGNVYMSYGSWFGGIAVVQINPSTGKIANGATPTKIAGGNGADWEAPYIVKEGSYYYLFVNRGNCCRRTNSTYRIVVGRATSITGPYVNRSGGNLNSTDGTTVLATSGKYIGPGHFGLLREGSCKYVSTHYYDGNDNGNAKLDILSLTFSNGWPSLTRNFTVGACAAGSGPIATGTYRLTNKDSNLSWDSWGCSGNAGEAVAQGAYNGYNCQKWHISSTSGSTYRIKSHINSNSAETTGCAAYTGALLQLGPYSNAACEQFTFTPTGDGDGSYYITLSSGGRRVGVPQFSGSGQQLQLQDPASHLWQKWFIVAVAP